MRSFIATALFAGLAVAVPAVTDVVYTTETMTITSCAPTVTNCPADSTVLTTKVYPVTSAPASLSTSTVYQTDEITITSCAADITDCPARVSTTSYAVSTTVVPWNTPVAKLGPGSSPAVAPYPMSGSWVAGPAAPSGTAPAPPKKVWGTAGAAAASGHGAGAHGAYTAGAAAATGTGSSTWAPDAIYTGAASHMNAGAALAGVGAIAAFIL